MSYEACIIAVREAAKDKLSAAELDSIEQRAAEIRKRIEAEGNLDGINERVRKAIAEEADTIRIAAALQRKQAMMNAIVRDRLAGRIADLQKRYGMRRSQAVLSILEGSDKNRYSVYSVRQGFERRYLGELDRSIFAERPHIQALVNDREFGYDVVREMAELREGGRPGITGNQDAKFVAQKFAQILEVSRQDVNSLGAARGKLDGYAGPQRHSAKAMLDVAPREWIDFTLGHLDIQRTFSGLSDAEIQEAMAGIYQHITTGIDDKLTAVGRGERVGPANLAKSLGKSRVLHFKNADAWIDYHQRFGDGTIFSAIWSHLSHDASATAQMQVLGPNPEVMLASVLEQLRRETAGDPNLTPKQKESEAEQLALGTGGRTGLSISQAFLEMSGATNTAANRRSADFHQGVRNAASMAYLGQATITAVPTDVLTTGLASMFRGGGFFRGVVRQLDMMTVGMNTADKRDFFYSLGQGFDAIRDNIVHGIASQDGVPGHLAKTTTTFFKLNGLAGWTDIVRRAAAAMVASDLGRNAGKTWDRLDARFSHFLSMHDITPAKWEVVRSTVFDLERDRPMVTADRMRNLSDEALEPLIAERMAGLTTKDPARRETARQRYLNDMRLELELDVARLIADETSYANIAVDARTRRVSLGGSQPGTAAGEARRYLLQFKSFPIAFTQRILGRALFAVHGETQGERLMHATANLGAVMSALTVAGYMSMVAKDTLKGRWPPRNPADANVLTAAMLQGGALGVYGDFLFGQANRFGNTALETAAGPVGSTAADLINTYNQIRAGKASKGELLNVLLNNTPYLNLWYARPVADALFLNSVREWASPGYRRRTEQMLREDYGQHLVFPH